MPAKKYSVEQIVVKLREHEKLQGQGLTIPQACKRIGISDQTFYRWRLKYGALKEDEAQRLKALYASLVAFYFPNPLSYACVVAYFAYRDLNFKSCD